MKMYSPENLERLKAQGFQKGNPYRFQKGVKQPLEWREKQREALRGKPFTEEHKDKIRKAALAHPERKRTMLGKHHTDMTRFKMSIKLKRHHVGIKSSSPETQEDWNRLYEYHKRIKRY